MDRPGADRRDALLDGTVGWVLAHGLADLSLRPLARDLGTSDRMLLYYFATKDALVTAAVQRVADTLVGAATAALGSRIDSPERLVDGFWRVLFDPAARSAVDLLLEVFALAARRGDPYRSAAQAVVRTWIDLAVPHLTTLGVPRPDARRVAVTVAALVDGGLVLATAGVSGRELAAVRRSAVRVVAEACR